MSKQDRALDRRRAGILLHPTSLPGFGINGELGAESRHFVDFLVQADVSVWQMLPLGPTHEDGSPYTCLSVHAGNPHLISLMELEEWGWLTPASATNREVDRFVRLRAAWHAFSQRATAEDREDMADFVGREQAWLDDFALYQALRQEQGGAPWWQWPAALRDREITALADARMRLAEEITQVRFEQFVFFRQWRGLKAYANERGILLFGDMPIFVAHDSAEVWAHREYFALDAGGQPSVVAGVPPDYFSETGQRWGNPLYRWERMEADGFQWWLARMRTQLELFDLIRIDHFRGFEAYWEIPASEPTAVKGRWVKAPGTALFTAFRRHFHRLPIVAEDLGLITPEVYALRERFGIPGMAVLQFAFDGGATNPYLPHRHEHDLVIYTGTHDNDTTLSWFQSLSIEQQAHVRDYLGHPQDEMPWALIRCAFASVGRLAVIPMQDLLGLGGGHRMNMPGTVNGNWQWRFQWDQLDAGVPARLKHLAELYGRRPRKH